MRDAHVLYFSIRGSDFLITSYFKYRWVKLDWFIRHYITVFRRVDISYLNTCLNFADQSTKGCYLLISLTLYYDSKNNWMIIMVMAIHHYCVFILFSIIFLEYRGTNETHNVCHERFFFDGRWIAMKRSIILWSRNFVSQFFENFTVTKTNNYCNICFTFNKYCNNNEQNQ